MLPAYKSGKIVPVRYMRQMPNTKKQASAGNGSGRAGRAADTQNILNRAHCTACHLPLLGRPSRYRRLAQGFGEAGKAPCRPPDNHRRVRQATIRLQMPCKRFSHFSITFFNLCTSRASCVFNHPIHTAPWLVCRRACHPSNRSVFLFLTLLSLTSVIQNPLFLLLNEPRMLCAPCLTD